MFIVSEYTPSGWKPTKTNNIRDIYDIVLNITNNEKEAEKATNVAEDMGFGGFHVGTFYMIECIRE